MTPAMFQSLNSHVQPGAAMLESRVQKLARGGMSNTLASARAEEGRPPPSGPQGRGCFCSLGGFLGPLAHHHMLHDNLGAGTRLRQLSALQQDPCTSPVLRGECVGAEQLLTPEGRPDLTAISSTCPDLALTLGCKYGFGQCQEHSQLAPWPLTPVLLPNSKSQD